MRAKIRTETTGGTDGSDPNQDAGNGNGGGGGASSDAAVGGLPAPAVVNTGDSNRPFGVNNNTFTSQDTAAQRACDIQRNNCFDAVNAGKVDGATSDCDAQVSACMADLSA